MLADRAQHPLAPVGNPTEVAPLSSTVASLDRDGFAILPEFLSEEEVRSLRQAIAVWVGPSRDGPAPGAGIYARRNLLDVPEARQLAQSRDVLEIVALVLGPGASPARGIFFDKVPGANWKVPWHQDLSIAVAERCEACGFGPWSVKDGVPHVQPPTQVLAGMLTVRFHLDDCGASNGPVRVVPGSHAEGKIVERGAEAGARARGEVVCEVPQGGALLMRPLILHASSPSAAPGHRRVVHLEYAAEDLPAGLEWYERHPRPSLGRDGCRLQVERWRMRVEG